MRAIVLIVLLSGIGACSGNRVYEDFNNLNGTWHQDSTLSFSFDIVDSVSSYDVLVSVSYGNTFPYHNFYFNYSLLNENMEIDQGLKELILFDPKTGQPRGSGSGNLYSQTQIILANFRFPKPGQYQVNLRQFMRQEELTAVERVGVRVEFSKTE